MRFRNKIILLVILFFTLIVLPKDVKANSIERIDMDINVQKNGNALITEIWTCTTKSGTEVYHPFYNLGNSEITNLQVSDGNTKYQTLSSWNTSGTLSSKSNKCGINNISNGVELCWGISSYGDHTYKATYTITNFVANLTDSQMIYWTLIPYSLSNAVGSSDIKISRNK